MHDALATFDAPLLDRLRAAVRGRVITPGDPDYDQRPHAHEGGVDRRPAAIVRVAGATDVARVIDLARDEPGGAAVRSGGHSIAGHGASTDGIVIDLARPGAASRSMSHGQTAWVATGCRPPAVHDGRRPSTAWPSGSATPARSGIGGITLGGGVGLSVAQARPDHRLPAGRRDRDRRRPDAAGRRRHGARPVLGDPRRRRQLRRRRPASGSGCTRSARSWAACWSCRRRRRRRRGSSRRPRPRPTSCPRSPTSCRAPPMPFVAARAPRRGSSSWR